MDHDLWKMTAGKETGHGWAIVINFNWGESGSVHAVAFMSDPNCDDSGFGYVAFLCLVYLCVLVGNPKICSLVILVVFFFLVLFPVSCVLQVFCYLS